MNWRRDQNTRERVLTSRHCGFCSTCVAFEDLEELGEWWHFDTGSLEGTFIDAKRPRILWASHRAVKPENIWLVSMTQVGVKGIDMTR